MVQVGCLAPRYLVQPTPNFIAAWSRVLLVSQSEGIGTSRGWTASAMEYGVTRAWRRACSEAHDGGLFEGRLNDGVGGDESV